MKLKVKDRRPASACHASAQESWVVLKANWGCVHSTKKRPDLSPLLSAVPVHLLHKFNTTAMDPSYISPWSHKLWKKKMGNKPALRIATILELLKLIFPSFSQVLSHVCVSTTKTIAHLARGTEF